MNNVFLMFVESIWIKEGGMRTLKNFFMSILERINSRQLERITAWCTIREQFSILRKLPKQDNREMLWDNIFKRFKNKQVTVLEFGVFKGYSIEKFSQLNKNTNSRFYGFDSFKGLPENWTSDSPKGAFNMGGKIPSFNDSRIIFIDGWLQNTLSAFFAKNKLCDNMFIHFDLDIFSATLYALMELDRLKKPYYAVFDEFTGHEARALYRYILISGAKIEFFESCGSKLYPSHVSCRIFPTKYYNP